MHKPETNAEFDVMDKHHELKELPTIQEEIQL